MTNLNFSLVFTCDITYVLNLYLYFILYKSHKALCNQKIYSHFVHPSIHTYMYNYIENDNKLNGDASIFIFHQVTPQSV